MERYILSALWLRPYRCIDCDNRFYDFPHFREAGSRKVTIA
jgi:hypothetical protein